MKKLVALLLVVAMVACLFVGCAPADEETPETSSDPAVSNDATGDTTPSTPSLDNWNIAMVTDYGDITDESFNQATYEGAKEWSETNGVAFSYYKPTDDSTEARVASIEQAIEAGANVILCPGYAFADSVKETAEENPDVYYIILDCAQSDYGEDYTLPANVFSAVYQEELAGYMAGYAAVKLGYTQLGFLGGMAVPAVIRYGYGFVQGADAAATETGADVSVKYVYGNQFSGDSDITAYMDTWYSTGTEIVFACGGGIYTSAAEAAAKVNAKVIGVDVDQAPTIDKYGEGMTVTSAMKGLAQTVIDLLDELILNDNWSAYGGKIVNLGLVDGEDPTLNYVQLPLETTQWGDGFTQDDYVALVGKMFNGEITVSNDTENAPTVSISVDYQGNIK